MRHVHRGRRDEDDDCASRSSWSSKCSRSSAGDSCWTLTGTANNVALRQTRALPQRAHIQQGSIGLGDLFSRLEAAEKQLQAQATTSASVSSESGNSEPRDDALAGQHIIEDLEKASRSGSGHSESDATRDQDQSSKGRATLIERMKERHGRADSGVKSSSSSSYTSKSVLSGSQSHDKIRQLKEQIEKVDIVQQKEELLKVVQEKDNEVHHLTTRIEEFVKHKNEDMANLEEVMNEKDERNREMKVSLTAEVKSLEANQQALKSQLASAKQVKDDAVKEKEDLTDRMEGLKARHLVEILRMEADMQAQLQTEIKQGLLEKVRENELKELMKAEVESLMQQLQRSQLDCQSATDERDMLRHSDVITKAESRAKQAKVALLNEELTVVQLRDGMSTKNIQEALASVTETERELHEEMLALNIEVATKRATRQAKGPDKGEDQRGISTREELRRKRLGTSGSTGYRGNLGNLGSDSNSTRSLGFSPLGRRLTRPAWSGKPALNKILEEDDLLSGDGSVAFSMSNCAVSSDAGGEGIGDMHDFDDLMEDPLGTLNDPARLQQVKQMVLQVNKEKEQLIQALDKKQREKDEMTQDAADKKKKEGIFQEEMVEQLAQNESKIARLHQQLQQKNMQTGEMEEEVMALRNRVEIKGVKLESVREKLAEVSKQKQQKESSFKELRRELDEKKRDKEQVEGYIQELEQQLETAWAKIRIAEAKIDDFRGAITTMEQRYEHSLEEQRQEIRVLKAACQEGVSAAAPTNQEGEEPPVKQVINSLWERIKSVTEERNMLQNTLEWKEVQWRNTIEDLEVQMANQAAELREQHRQQLESVRARLLQHGLCSPRQEPRSLAPMVEMPRQEAAAAAPAAPPVPVLPAAERPPTSGTARSSSDFSQRSDVEEVP